LITKGFIKYLWNSIVEISASFCLKLSAKIKPDKFKKIVICHCFIMRVICSLDAERDQLINIIQNYSPFLIAKMKIYLE